MRAAAALLLWLVLAGAGAAAAQGLPPGVTADDRAAIQSVINQQLRAFQQDDAAGAYAFAAPSIQRMFPDPGIFMDMVRRSYAPVYRPKQAEFSALAERDGALVQEVELVGPDGHAVLALYMMERGADGLWRISGCSLVPSTRLGV